MFNLPSKSRCYHHYEIYHLANIELKYLQRKKKQKIRMENKGKNMNNFNIKNVTPAPRWMVERMEKLRKMPPPSLEEVRKQLKASAEYQYKIKKQKR